MFLLCRFKLGARLERACLKHAADLQAHVFNLQRHSQAHSTFQAQSDITYCLQIVDKFQQFESTLEDLTGARITPCRCVSIFPGLNLMELVAWISSKGKPAACSVETKSMLGNLPLPAGSLIVFDTLGKPYNCWETPLNISAHLSDPC